MPFATWIKLMIATGGIVFPIFLNRVLEEVGFAGMVRYSALFVGILLASSCLLITARLPRKEWNPKLNWIDFSLFKDPAFASYTVGAYLVMFVDLLVFRRQCRLTSL